MREHLSYSGLHSDPFGVLLLNNQRKFKTKVIKKTLFPTWSEKALLPAVEVTSSLVVQIWDHDAVTAAEFLGQVTLNMEAQALKHA